MQITHTVQTDDGSVRLDLGDGSTIFDLIACGPNGQEITVYLGYHQAHRLLIDAGAIRIAFGTGAVEERTSATMGGVVEVGDPEGAVTLALASRAGCAVMTVADGRGGHTTLTLGGAANDCLIVGVGTILSKL